MIGTDGERDSGKSVRSVQLNDDFNNKNCQKYFNFRNFKLHQVRVHKKNVGHKLNPTALKMNKKLFLHFKKDLNLRDPLFNNPKIFLE